MSSCGYSSRSDSSSSSNNNESESESSVSSNNAGAESNQYREVKPLAVLAARTLETHLKSAEKQIPTEAEAHVSARRTRLLEELEALEEEKDEYAVKRRKELAARRNAALDQMKVAGGSDSFCERCKKFYRKVQNREEWGCSLADCPSFESNQCLKCQRRAGRRVAVKDEDPCPHQFVWYEQYCFDDEPGPSPTGFATCWICEKKFCNQCFVKRHYRECRSEASKKCGFRPPQGINKSNKRTKCVPGHCGKTISDGDGAFFCGTQTHFGEYDNDSDPFDDDAPPDDAVDCWTVCCERCASVCERKVPGRYGGRYGQYDVRCRRVSCKKHRDDCTGPCTGRTDYW